MQHLDIRRKGLKGFPLNSYAVLAQVRFLAYHRIKPHVPPLVRAPVNSFEFHRCRRTPQVAHLIISISPIHSYRTEPVSIVYGVDYQGI